MIHTFDGIEEEQEQTAPPIWRCTVTLLICSVFLFIIGFTMQNTIIQVTAINIFQLAHLVTSICILYRTSSRAFYFAWIQFFICIVSHLTLLVIVCFFSFLLWSVVALIWLVWFILSICSIAPLYRYTNDRRSYIFSIIGTCIFGILTTLDALLFIKTDYEIQLIIEIALGVCAVVLLVILQFHVSTLTVFIKQ